MLTVTAPAKLNLTLEVLGKRPDGFHEVRSVMQAISLYDRLHFQMGDGISIRCDMPGWEAGESLMGRAAALLQHVTGCRRGAQIAMLKRIPLSAGLGGDSSDAAATLHGLNELWGLKLSAEKLQELAARLGSDVPFFLRGGTALAEGRGELLAPLPPPPRLWVVLVVPQVPRLPGKTARLYASLKASHYTDGRITERLAAALRKGRGFSPQLLFNTFENVAFAPSSGLRVYRGHLLKMGADNVHLAGSGPTVFSLAADKAKAEDLYTRCLDQRMEAYLVETVEG